MSAPVDVLAVMDSLNLGETVRRAELLEARAAVAELIEAVEAYAEAEAALANREIEGINAEGIDRLQPRVHAARRDLESAIARVKGGAA